eukprot:jgi/Phyca11/537536/estExt2_fgenesh1_pg.C_PHYCAscaffold_960015
MDAVAMDSSDKWDFVFSGEFCDVVKFVKILVGDDPYRQKQNSMMSYEDWLESWNDWQICFSHFVDLQEEPTEDVLWKLLDRRAAGTFPRGQKGADLLLPIFRPKCDSYPEGKVSFIVVQVKNRVDQDDKLPDSALRKLSCSYVFKEANTLSKLKNHEVIRLYVSLREVLDEDHFAQSIEMKEIRMPRAQKKPKSTSDFDGALEKAKRTPPKAPNTLSAIFRGIWRQIHEYGYEEMYTAPYVTITQSSGFGKSRILKRLAEKEGVIKHDNVSFDMKVLFAARKLLIGLDMNQQESYTDSTLHGVSSLFCRLGLRPYASSPIATRLVANFMCVLHYVGYKNDTQISGYVSEPILTFGAARMWHQFENPTHNWPSALESKILPQLETILLNGLIDTGNIGELVARIFLLLAMDAILVGDDPYRQKQNGMMSYEDWLESWNDWQICFSHFVDLQEEPTEDVLWKLLDRRAAGAFPREQDGADLLLPIFRPKCDSYPEGKVSFIVVQVKNRVDQDDKLPDSALRKLSCSYVFKEANTLSKLKDHEVIRLYGVAEKLSKIASTAWWNGEVQVKYDLKSRDDHEKKTHQHRLSSVLSADDAEKTASHTLKFASKVTAQ